MRIRQVQDFLAANFDKNISSYVILLNPPFQSGNSSRLLQKTNGCDYCWILIHLCQRDESCFNPDTYLEAIPAKIRFANSSGGFTHHHDLTKKKC